VTETAKNDCWNERIKKVGEDPKNREPQKDFRREMKLPSG